MTIILFAGSVCAGVVNAFAAGCAFITLPLLIIVGLQPTVANRTGSISTWPGLVIAAWQSRKSILKARHHLKLMSLIVGFWALLGSALIMVSSDHFFMRIVPYLLILATLIFIYGTWFLRRAPVDISSQRFSVSGLIGLSAIGLYGSYWGGGMGIMTISLLTLIGWTDIHEMNAVKLLLMTFMNGVGIVLFIGGGYISWPHAVVVGLGSSIGGYLAGDLIPHVPPKLFKIAVVIYAAGMNLFFLVR